MWMQVKSITGTQLYVNFDNVKLVFPSSNGSIISFISGDEHAVAIEYSDLIKQIENLRNFMRTS